MNYKDYDSLIINGHTLRGSSIIEFCYGSEEKHLQLLGNFMENWLDSNPLMELSTSGSTGHPKKIVVEKNQMLESARMSVQFFGLQEGQTALLCLPLEYIAGKMMVVRALYKSLHLFCIEPSSHPLRDLSINQKIHFAPLVPMQVENIPPNNSLEIILLGGAPVSPDLGSKLQSFTSTIYHSYGMTETLTHVAARKINGVDKSETFHALPGVQFETDSEDQLIIHVPFLHEPVRTKDIVTLLSPTEFKWKGRSDFVINSGGVKLFPEEMETKLAPFISQRFFILGIPDDRLGEKCILVVEGEKFTDEEMELLHQKLQNKLSKFEQPKHIFFTLHFLQTSSGKILRKETLNSIDMFDKFRF